MKKVIVLLTVLISVCGYGQEVVQDTITPKLLICLNENITKLKIKEITNFTTDFNDLLLINDKEADDNDGNVIKYIKTGLVVSNDYSISNIISLFDLDEKYSTPLQKENFKNSNEFQVFKNRKDSLRKIEFSKIYAIDLRLSENSWAAQGEFVISNYDLNQKGFNLFFNVYYTVSYHPRYSIMIPKSISRVCFDFVPFINPKIPESASAGKNILFIPMDTNKGAKIELSRVALKILFQLNDGLKTDPGALPYLKAKNCKLIIYDLNTEEILYSKSYKLSDIPIKK